MHLSPWAPGDANVASSGTSPDWGAAPPRWLAPESAAPLRPDLLLAVIEPLFRGETPKGFFQ